MFCFWDRLCGLSLFISSHVWIKVYTLCVLQPWNPYKPLPPTPVSELRSSSSSTESLPTDPQQSPSPHVPSPSSATFTTSSVAAAPALHPEVDPYHSLSSDAKTFVNNLTAMGFSRSRASRAVEKFGADEREVWLVYYYTYCPFCSAEYSQFTRVSHSNQKKKKCKQRNTHTHTKKMHLLEKCSVY